MLYFRNTDYPPLLSEIHLATLYHIDKVFVLEISDILKSLVIL
jgi:hypothetical protein